MKFFFKIEYKKIVKILILIIFEKVNSKNKISNSSIYHYDKSINQSNSNKLDIIEFYNKNIRVVDTVDRLIENLTCRRKTNI